MPSEKGDRRMALNDRQHVEGRMPPDKTDTPRTVTVELREIDARALLTSWYGAAVTSDAAFKAERAARAIEDALTGDQPLVCPAEGIACECKPGSYGRAQCATRASNAASSRERAPE